jgi:hypothetical protein
MDLTARLDLGDLRLWTLLQDDADLLVEATRQEQAPALWGRGRQIPIMTR